MNESLGFTLTDQALMSVGLAGSSVVALENVGLGDMGMANLNPAIGAVPPAELSAEERAGLLFMYEEEKLARDVYLTLGAQFDVPVFENIAASEMRHMSAVADLLDRYDLEFSGDPEAIGTFVDPDLQALYDELTARGTTSLVEALRVGATIEEVDIADLKTHTEATENPDIKRVYDNLARGSRNHLRAFSSNLINQTAEAYIPQYLDQFEYDSITGSMWERGTGENCQGGQGGQGRQGGQGGQGRQGGGQGGQGRQGGGRGGQGRQGGGQGGGGGQGRQGGGLR
jgi:hypothetical protein